MTVHYKTRGFVFKKEDRADSDRVFSVFTEDFGRLEITGRAIRKMASKLRGGMELFSFCQMEFVQGRHKKTLTDALAVEKFKSIVGSPEKLSIALDICQLVDSFIRGQEKDEKILALLVETFSRLCTYKPRKLIYYYFFWNFIVLLGHGPEINNGEVSGEVTMALELITKKDWDALEKLGMSPGAQKSFQQISHHHYIRLKESYA